MKIVDISHFSIERTVLLDVARQELDNCLLGDNFDQLPDLTLAKRRGEIYSARSVAFDAVELFRFPKNCRLFGGWNFLVEKDGVALKDQVPPSNVLPDLNEIDKLAADPLEAIQVDEPCVLVSRFGLMVWGHWVGELLPRILLTERKFPGQFKYVLPPHVFNSSAPRSIWNSIWDTIRNLGIDRNRILQARPDRHYIFSRLFGVNSIIMQNAFHPDALDHMRAAYGRIGVASSERKVAILRTESKARNISNLSAIIPILQSRDYEFVEVGTLPFEEQVHLFSSTKILVGVLASGLTGLFFSPDKVKVLSFAPEGFVNKFFYPIMQARQASYFDVRGRITERDPRSDVFSNFHIDISHFEQGLDKLEQV